MKIRELFENITDEYLNNPDEIDARFNREALEFSSREREFRRRQGVGVVKKPRKEKEVFSTEPKDPSIASPGKKTLDWVNKKIFSRRTKSC